MSEHNTRRLGPFGLFLGLLITATAVGFWYSNASVHAEKTPQPGADVLARIGEVEIREVDLEAANAEGFLKLHRDRHELVEATLQGVIQEKLLEIEAAAQGVTVEDLTAAEVDAKASAATDADVDAFYEANKGRINQPKESVEPRIREYLAAESRQGAFDQYIEALGEKYEIQTFLEPLRFEVEAAGFPAKGPEAAPVTIVEFSDFECPYCSRVVPTLDRVSEEYGDRVRLVFRQFPLPQIHPNAQKAAEASLCANDQDQFWQLHDMMFQEQKALAVEQLKEKAARLGLEAETFNQCLDTGKYADTVTADVEAGRVVGVTGTPAMFINGRFLSGAQPYEEIARVIEDELERLQ